MDYSKYLELIEKFLSKAGTVLKKRGEDYPDSPASPSFILVDEKNGKYHMMEIAMPPEVPALPAGEREVVNEYASINGVDPDILAVVSELGKDVSAARTHVADETLDESLARKLALCLPYANVAAFREYAVAKDIEMQEVPVSDLFSVFFFKNKAVPIVEGIYKELFPLAAATVPEQEHPEQAPQAQEFLPEPLPEQEHEQDAPKEEEVHELEEPVQEEAQEELINEELVQDEPSEEVPDDFTDDPDFLETGDKIDEFFATEPERMVLHDDIPAGIFNQEENILVDDAPPPRQALVVDEDILPDTDEKADEIKNGMNIAVPIVATVKKSADKTKKPETSDESTFVRVFRHIWSFIAFAPVYLIHVVTRGRVPQFVVYWVGAMVVLLGLYYFPLSTAFGGIADTVGIASLNAASDISGLWNRFDISGVDYQGVLPFDIGSYMGNLFSMAIAALSLNYAILSFLNSPYFLQTALSVGYFLAIVPAWRQFAKRLTVFMVAAYLLYIPAMLVGASAIKLIIAAQHAQADVYATLFAAMGSVGGIIAVLVLIPVMVMIFALNACKSKADIL